MKPSLLVKDLGGLFLYYPGQAVINRVPREGLIGAARVGAGVVRRLGDAEMRDELRRIYTTRPMPRSEDAILADAGLKPWRLIDIAELDRELIERASGWDAEERRNLERYLERAQSDAERLFRDLRALVA